MDGDAGLKQAFATVLQPEVSAGRAHLVVAEDRTNLCASTGLTSTEVSLIPSEFYAEIVDEEVAVRLASEPVGEWFEYPFPMKSEPNDRVLLLTDHPGLDGREKAKLMRHAAQRRQLPPPVPVKYAFRQPTADIHKWPRPRLGGHHLYDPVVLTKRVEIYRFYHNWMEPGVDGKTPVMRGHTPWGGVAGSGSRGDRRG